MRTGDMDGAVEHFRTAVQEDPDRADYQIPLERAMMAASTQHLDEARVLEVRGQLEEALREYRRASEYNPSNRQIAGKVTEMERRIRDLVGNISHLTLRYQQAPDRFRVGDSVHFPFVDGQT